MKQIEKLFAAWFICSLPALAAAQITVKGYTDAKGQPLPGGDTRIELGSDGSTTSLKLGNLYAYGEAGMSPNDNGKREAAYTGNPSYFRGGTVYALRNGEDWCGGRTAQSALAAIKSQAKRCGGVVGQGKIGDNEVAMTFPSMKATGTDDKGRPIKVTCQTMSFVLEKADGKAAWLGHPGWATSNTAAGIGDYMVLAHNDRRFPATATCYDTAGKIVKLTPELRAELSRIIKGPEGSTAATAKANDQ